jgi:transposase-like protein
MSVNEANLRQRLAAGQLTPDDKALLERARLVRVERSAGRAFTEIAPRVGITHQQLARWVRGATYRVLAEYLDRGAVAEANATAEGRVQEARTALAGLAPDAVRVLEESFARHPAGTQRTIKGPDGKPQAVDIGGTLVSKADAQWAAEKVLRGTGLTETGISARPVVVINVESIKAVLTAIRADVARPARAPEPVEIDVSPAAEGL